MFFLISKLYYMVEYFVNYILSKFGSKILKLLNLEWKILSKFLSLLLRIVHCDILQLTH
jgi:hypothetical protein